ncbi:MAG TPA: Trp biosynthesis-associated membrane protein [Candidatus Agrococcus pullicola]|uniref:Trp biosynthesis-associated membrane protein n=1 Tax=Candidatus Agrococcus pullicola TaxID=2838429 RepID=A0A9D2C7X7_9MICO|nr:Trp biosynthesis-associated membrane protein [Candidatus Agrococcus pullicola]
MIAKRGKSIAVLAAVLGLLLTGIAPTQDWVQVIAEDTEPFTLTGADLSGALLALALALGALSLTLLFAGRILSAVCGAVMALIGVALIVTTVGAASAENRAVAEEVAARTGLTGGTTQTVEVLWAFPALALAGGALAVLGGLWTIATFKFWKRQPKSKDKYELRSGALAWDVLDEGNDPTLDDAQEQHAKRQEAQGRKESGEPPAARRDADNE